jgi:hypothetical protein
MNRDIEIVQVTEIRDKLNNLLGMVVKAKVLGEDKPEQISSLGSFSFYVPGVVEEYVVGQRYHLEMT